MLPTDPKRQQKFRVSPQCISCIMSSTTHARLSDEAHEMLDAMSESLPGSPPKSRLNSRAVEKMYHQMIERGLLDDEEVDCIDR